MMDISSILTLKFYFMLLSYDSDMINNSKNYIQSYILNQYTKFLKNNQLLILFKSYCYFY